jgi:hypothetical protein
LVTELCEVQTRKDCSEKPGSPAGGRAQNKLSTVITITKSSNKNSFD